MNTMYELSFTYDNDGRIVSYLPDTSLEDINTEALRKAYEFAVNSWKAQDGKWNQSTWFRETDCGTSYCIAGFVAIVLAGAIPQFDDYLDRIGSVVRLSGKQDHVYCIAQSYLNLRVDDADNLFDENNSIHDLRLIVSGLLREDLPELES